MYTLCTQLSSEYSSLTCVYVKRYYSQPRTVSKALYLSQTCCFNLLLLGKWGPYRQLQCVYWMSRWQFLFSLRDTVSQSVLLCCDCMTSCTQYLHVVGRTIELYAVDTCTSVFYHSERVTAHSIFTR